MRIPRATALATLALLLASPAPAQNGAPGPANPAPASPAPTSPAPAARPATPAPSPSAPAQGALLDVNTATKEQLDALPQIGPARAEAIIKGRPYRAKNELLDKGILPQNAYDAVKDRIIARHGS